jgi:hypothetical protein
MDIRFFSEVVNFVCNKGDNDCFSLWVIFVFQFQLTILVLVYLTGQRRGRVDLPLGDFQKDQYIWQTLHGY